MLLVSRCKALPGPPRYSPSCLTELTFSKFIVVTARLGLNLNCIWVGHRAPEAQGISMGSLSLVSSKRLNGITSPMSKPQQHARNRQHEDMFNSH